MLHTESHSYPSYSQAGEDRIVYYIFERSGRKTGLSYMDIGASAPAGHNNTYLFYTLEGRGVLVEADPVYRPAYQIVRPDDKIENVAVVPSRLKADGTVTFHVMADQGWSTVSPEHAKLGERMGKGQSEQLKLTVPCVTIDEVLTRHFPKGELDILSVDIEGIDLEVLNELDTILFRPKVIIVENKLNPLNLEERKFQIPGYVIFASTYINSIYIREEFLKSLAF